MAISGAPGIGAGIGEGGWAAAIGLAGRDAAGMPGVDAAGWSGGPRYCRYAAPAPAAAIRQAQKITKPFGRRRGTFNLPFAAKNQFEAVLGPDEIMPSASLIAICS